MKTSVLSGRLPEDGPRRLTNARRMLQALPHGLRVKRGRGPSLQHIMRLFPGGDGSTVRIYFQVKARGVLPLVTVAAALTFLHSWYN